MKIYSDGKNRVLTGKFPKSFKVKNNGLEVPFIRTGADSIRLSGQLPVGDLDIEEVVREAKRPSIFQDSKIVMVSEGGIARLEQVSYDLEEKAQIIDEKANQIKALGDEVSGIEKGNAESIKQMGDAMAVIVGNLKKDIETNVKQASEIKRSVSQLALSRFQDVSDSLIAHEEANNPHRITKATIGLDKVENISPADLPVSKATQKALDKKADKTDVEDLKSKLDESSKTQEKIVKGLDRVNWVGGVGGAELPSGGSTGQVLAKKSDQTGDYEWITQSQPNGIYYYGTCSTAASTQQKDVVCDGFELKTGVGIRVKFTNNQNYNGNPTLNVNGTGAISIKNIGTTNAGRYYWQDGEVVDFTYDGTYWLMDNGGIATTTYYGRTKLADTATNTSSSLALVPRTLNNVIQNMIEPYAVYSSSSTYKVGDRVRYGSQAYECNTAITTAESWTAAHWTALPAIQDQLDITNNRVSNVIVEIPQDIKLELKNGVLTLKSGSVITAPDGTQVQTTSDKTHTYSTSSGKRFIYLSLSNNNLQSSWVSVVGSGSSLPADNTDYSIFFNATDSKIYNWNSGSSSWAVLNNSLPIAIVTIYGGQISSVDKVFNGAGYVGHHAFVLPSVKALVPNGHNEDGSLKSYNTTISSLQIIEMRNPSYGTNFSYPIQISYDGGIGRSAYRVVNNNTELLKQGTLLQYVKEDNLVQLYSQNTDSFSPQPWTPFVYYNWDGTSVTKFEVRQVVRFATKEMLRGEPNYYGTCSTAASTQTKDVVCDGFELKEGVSIRVKFTNNQNYNGNPLLNVNGTGAISIKQKGTTNAARYEWDSGEVVDFTYDGTYWIIENGAIATIQNYGRTILTNSVTYAGQQVSTTQYAINSLVQNMIEPYPVYSTSSTYKVGDRVRYNYNAWECNTAITTAESWTAAHWTVLPAIQDQLDITNNRVSNVIAEIPQDIKLELSSGTLTLKSGSILTAPDGTQYATTSDKTYTHSITSSDGQYAVFASRSSGSIQGPTALSKISSGPTSSKPEWSSSIRGSVYYDTTTNKICYAGSSSWNDDWTVALPFCIVTITNNVITSIDKVFNGIGFIGTAFFALPGMSYLFADGLNTDGTLKSGYKKLTSLVIRNFSVGNNTYTSWLNHNGGFANNYASNVYYDKNTNHVVSSNADQRGCIAVNWTQSGGIITEFNVRPVYRDVTEEMLDTELQSYSEKTSVITLEDSSTITLAENAIYNGGTLTALTVDVPVSATASFISQFNFTSGTTATTLTSTNIVWTGDDTLGGAFTPVASKRYTCMVYYDGVQFVGVSIGV